MARYALRFTALGYLAVLLCVPVGLVFWLTILIALVAVPANTIFGVVLALALVRKPFPGKGLVNAVVDLPLALSPVVVGLSLLLLYARLGWFGPLLARHGIEIVFAPPWMILATIFVSLPFVVREVQPVLREIGTEQEQAAATLGASAFQTFRRITLPSIRWALTYGIVLATARALGEFGALSVVSGNIQGETETMTLFVEQRFRQFDLTGAYAASVVLAVLAVATLLSMNLLNRRRRRV